MDIEKCRIISKKIGRGEYKRIILDGNNKVIEDAIIDQYKINDINFNNLPSNVFNDVKLYLGKEYESNIIISIGDFLMNDTLYSYFLQSCHYNLESNFGIELLKYVEIKKQEECI